MDLLIGAALALALTAVLAAVVYVMGWLDKLNDKKKKIVQPKRRSKRRR